MIFSDLCSARRANIIFFHIFFVTRAIDLAKTRTARSLWKSSRREIRVSMDSSYLSRFHPRTSTFHQDIFPFLMTILSIMYCFLQELCDFKYHISFDWYLFLFSRTFYSNIIFGYFSLENISDKIRWSLDLRWQRPDKPNGFYGLKVYWQCQDGDLVAHVVKKKYRAIDEAIKLRRFIQMTTLSWSFSQAR